MLCRLQRFALVTLWEKEGFKMRGRQGTGCEFDTIVCRKHEAPIVASPVMSEL